ncbi:putative membrane protein [Bacteriovorax sp. BAL6_X]|uniref:hypothetical protein n=1 Tax=Bacteriovorax sp. BAL6_X TaxID=1201290 RepID=UPI000386A174|nr:hypothetical protein [Bacteriovorax sp. BAL6_X]EPZ50437.1 putative membrane protein [Bacteriovorax sp. BAL6_X]
MRSLQKYFTSENITLFLFSLLFYYLGYIYFFDFNQGTSLAPKHIKAIKDLILISILILNIKLILKSFTNLFSISIIVPTLTNLAITLNLNILLQQRNLIYSIILGNILNSFDSKKVYNFIFINFRLSILLGLALFPFSPWESQDMIGALGSPANFYFILIFYITLKLNNSLEIKSKSLNYLDLIILNVAIISCGSLAAIVIYLVVIHLFIIKLQLTNNNFTKNLNTYLKLIVIITSIIYLIHISFENLFNMYLIKILLSKIPYLSEFIDLKYTSSLSLINRSAQLSSVNTINFKLINISDKYIYSDFQYLEILVNQGIIPFIIFYGVLLRELIISIKNLVFKDTALLAVILLTMIFTPIMRYIPSGAIICYYILGLTKKSQKL